MNRQDLCLIPLTSKHRKEKTVSFAIVGFVVAHNGDNFGQVVQEVSGKIKE